MVNYSIIGTDKVLIDGEISKIKEEIKEEYDEVVIDLSEDKAFNLIEEINTYSFFSSLKLIICHNSQLIKEDSLPNKEMESLIDKLKNDNKGVLIIFIFTNIDSKNKFHKAIKKHTNNIVVKNMDAKGLNAYIIDYLKNEKFTIKSDVLDKLLLKTSNSLELTINELNKLMIYKNEDRTVLLSDIELLVSDNIEDNVFTLTDAVLSKDKKLTMKLYNDFTVKKIDELAMIGLLSNKFNEMYNVKVLMNEGYSQNLIAQTFDVTTGRAFYMVKVVNNINLNTIKEKIEKLSNLEYSIKSGLIDKKIGLEIFLLC